MTDIYRKIQKMYSVQTSDNILIAGGQCIKITMDGTNINVKAMKLCICHA